MLHFVVEGEGWVSCPDGTHERIGPNWVVVIPNGRSHSLDTREPCERELRIDCTPTGPPVHYIVAGEDGPSEMKVGCGTLNVRYGEALGLFDHLDEMLIIDLSGVPEVPALFRLLLDEHASEAPGKPVLQGAVMTHLLVYMLRALSEDSESNLTWLNALEDPLLAQAIDHILEDPGAVHSVESLAQKACMSRSAFAKRFQEAFNQSPMSLVNHVRLERAAKMITAGRSSIEQIGKRVGFSSRSHFSQAFKKHTGSSPAVYRDRRNQ